ncbi:hypothetical protein CSZ94_11320 [Janthinobacterium sp. ROICE36]|uniref:hypothetical protein n=1 Tax=Janthinobacterium sp. ROICE36 TaxID=2048670 RepID=UPI000C7E88F9|nr:hypothetical protein [Janthinobacterium sp. ROICE36]PLY42238.1 hypothetical protein CSZ94_11320 [Janthinobacterium sp. ROICE36]
MPATAGATLLVRVLAPQRMHRPGRSLGLQFHIWHHDVTGRLLVRVLFDDINARSQDAAILALDSPLPSDVRIVNPGRKRDAICLRA